MFRKIFIIINPASGRVEPILWYINKSLIQSDISWEIAITKKKDDAYALTKQALRKNFDLIAVYGGDGTVMEVAQALYQRKTPLLILPGGTANVMAKEIGMPESSEQAITLLTRKKVKLTTVDMGLLGTRPFILRLNIGILAEMVKGITREDKEHFGRLAYSIAALKHVIKHDIYSFSMTIDGKEVKETGVALMVANAGNIGVAGFSVLPRVNVSDGYLDVVLFKTATVDSLFSWVRSTVSRKKPQGSIKHWKAKEMSIHFTPHTKIICDDIPLAVSTIHTKIAPQSLTVVIP